MLQQWYGCENQWDRGFQLVVLAPTSVKLIRIFVFSVFYSHGSSLCKTKTCMIWSIPEHVKTFILVVGGKTCVSSSWSTGLRRLISHHFIRTDAFIPVAYTQQHIWVQTDSATAQLTLPCTPDHLPFFTNAGINVSPSGAVSRQPPPSTGLHHTAE